MEPSTLTTEELETAWNAVHMAFDYVDLYHKVCGKNLLDADPDLKQRLSTMKSELDAWHYTYMGGR